MIEPLEGEKQCRRCGECKPLSGFSPCAGGGRQGRHAYCKQCRCAQAKARVIERRALSKPGRVDVWPRNLTQALLDVRASKWAGPVDRSPLRWAE